MIRLRFFNLQPPAAVEVDGDEFLFDGDEVRRLPDMQLVAKHRDTHWTVGNETYMRLEVLQRVECRFESEDRAEERHGPFAHVAAVDSVLIVDGKPLAMLKDRRWSEMESAREWARLRVCTPA